VRLAPCAPASPSATGAVASALAHPVGDQRATPRMIATPSSSAGPGSSTTAPCQESGRTQRPVELVQHAAQFAPRRRQPPKRATTVRTSSTGQPRWPEVVWSACDEDADQPRAQKDCSHEQADDVPSAGSALFLALIPGRAHEPADAAKGDVPVSRSARCRSTRGHRREPDEQQHNAEPGHNWTVSAARAAASGWTRTDIKVRSRPRGRWRNGRRAPSHRLRHRPRLGLSSTVGTAFVVISPLTPAGISRTVGCS
jgi:hypothetical protein